MGTGQDSNPGTNQFWGASKSKRKSDTVLWYTYCFEGQKELYVVVEVVIVVVEKIHSSCRKKIFFFLCFFSSVLCVLFFSPYW